MAIETTPRDLFRYDDGRTIEVPWESLTRRAMSLRPPEPIQPGERYVLNDLRFAFRHATEDARYIGTLRDVSAGSASVMKFNITG